MGYDPSLKKIIKTVEATRPKRIAEYKAGEHFDRMTMEQRQEILEDFHPDFRKDAKREVAVGPNAGEVYRVLECQKAAISGSPNLAIIKVDLVVKRSAAGDVAE